MREAHCPECVGSVLGEHPRDWTERHADSARWLGAEHRALLYRPYVGCSLNSPAGMALPVRSWQAITQHAEAFCDRHHLAYDDAIHALQNAQGAQRTRALEPGWLTSGYPRCLHVGRCGGVSFHAESTLPPDEAAQACNVSADLEVFARMWVAPHLEGGALAGAAGAPAHAVPKSPRQSWRIDEGVALCRARYVATGDKLVGVAPSPNHTLPMKFKEACLTLLRQ